MGYTRNPRRLSALATVTALAVAATATCAGGATGRDCAPSGIDVDVGGQPLTRAERIARLDEALSGTDQNPTIHLYTCERVHTCERVRPEARSARVRSVL